MFSQCPGKYHYYYHNGKWSRRKLYATQFSYNIHKLCSSFCAQMAVITFKPIFINSVTSYVALMIVQTFWNYPSSDV